MTAIKSADKFVVCFVFYKFCHFIVSLPLNLDDHCEIPSNHPEGCSAKHRQPAEGQIKALDSLILFQSLLS